MMKYEHRWVVSLRVLSSYARHVQGSLLQLERATRSLAKCSVVMPIRKDLHKRKLVIPLNAEMKILLAKSLVLVINTLLDETLTYTLPNRFTTTVSMSLNIL